MRYLKYLKKGTLIILVLGLLYALFILGLILSNSREKPKATADTLLILGAQVKGDPAYPSKSLQNRLDTAYDYLEQHPKTVAIVCGGQGSDESATEASVMKDYLVGKGIAENRITLEDTSTDTKENISNALAIGVTGRVAIVTNDFHIYRGKLLAARLGLKNVEGLAAPSPASTIFKSYIREICSLGYHLIFN